MAHLSGDETYLEAFAKGQEPHLAIAANKYVVSYEEAHNAYCEEQHPDYKLWKNRRKQAKQICFGIIYGISVFGLAERMNVERKEAKELIDGYFETYP